MRSKRARISDGYGRAGCLDRVHVVVAPEHTPPFPVDVAKRRAALWLGRCLSRTSFRYLKRVWVIAPAGSEAKLTWALRSEFTGRLSTMFHRAWVKRACGLLMIGWSSLAAAAGSGWYYTIDQPREKQQANFCHSKNSTEEIAGIFNRFGPRTGYAALSTSPDCGIAVRSFTPRRILATVTISKGEPGEYMVRFVEVENNHGDVIYLVTTRNVLAE